MDDRLRIIASTDDPAAARAWGLMLEAVGLPHRVVDHSIERLPFEPDEDDLAKAARYLLVVSVEDADRAHALLDAEREEEVERRARAARVVHEPPRASDARAWAVTCALGVVLLLVYLRSPGFDADISRTLRVDAERILQGEWWRLIGGALLHSDPGHLAGNLSFLLPLGYFCVRRFGAGALLFGFVATAALGFAASVFWHGVPYRSVGASGGMFGLLGLLVGAALGEDAPQRDPRQRRRELLGATLGLLGMTAFGRAGDEPGDFDLFVRVAHRVDMAAHVFGFLAGVVIGALLIRVRRRWRPLDAAVGLLATACVALALFSATRS